MRTRRWGRLAAALAAMGSMIGAGAAAGADTPSRIGSAEPVAGGRLTYNIQFESRGLDPVMIVSLGMSSSDGIRSFALYDALLIQNSETGEVEPQTAESIESDDALVWTLTLKPDITFSDGTPYDAEAVKYNFERYADPEFASAALNVANSIDSMTVIDPLTLEITLKGPNGQFPRSIATRLAAIASPTAIEGGVDLSTDPVGAGPFVLDSWVRDSELRLTRNPTYWNAPSPYLDELVLRVIPDNEQRYQSFTVGEADVMYMTGVSVIARAKAEGYAEHAFIPNGGRLIVLNTQAPPFDDPIARQALAHAINPAGYTDVFEQGAGVPITNVFNEDSPFYDASLTIPGYDHDLAQELLDQYAAEHGGPLEFEILTSASTNPQAEYFQAQLTEFTNISVTLRQIDNLETTPTMIAGDYQAAAYALIINDPEPDLYDGYLSTSATNLSGYSSPVVDEALQAAHVSLDLGVRREAYAAVQAQLNEDVPNIWYARFQQYNFYDGERVQGFAIFQDGVPRVDQMWVTD